MAVKPKLALIPSGVKASKVYSVLPSDGTGDFDFSRSGSATRINKDGLIETVASNVPRLNYPLIDGVVSGCPSLLLEPESRNLITYSEDFNQSDWSKISIITDSNSSISPDGTLNATKITKSASNSLIRTFITTSGANTFSVYVKKGSLSWVRLYIASETESAEAWFDLENGNIGHSSGNPNDIKIVPMDNGWYRCIITKNTTNITNFRIYPSKADDDTSGTSGDIYVWGAQLEQQSYPTSYIPTSGSVTTRSAETCNNSGDANTFNDSEGVLMAEISALDDDGTNRFISLTDGSNDNRVLFGYRAASNQIFARIEGNNSASVDLTNVVSDTEIVIKLAIYYDSSFNYKMYLNGFLVDNAIGTDSIIGLDTFDFTNATGTENFYGNTKQIQYFDTALTDTDLEELTSWQSFNEMAESQQYSVY